MKSLVIVPKASRVTCVIPGLKHLYCTQINFRPLGTRNTTSKTHVTTKDMNQSFGGDSVTMAAPKDVVLVTGGAGFLGQHIIGHLQVRADYVREIKVLDIKPYRNMLGYKELKPLTSIVGDICDWDTVQLACKGVTSVIHVAGLVSYGTFPDLEGMQKINVSGTQNIVAGCVQAGVERLIFCSTVDVVVGFDSICNGRETTTSIPDKFLFPGYPETKHQADCIVLQANGRKCEDGKTLRTMSLRANVMYGEGDPYYVTSGLKSAAKNGRYLVQVGDGQAKMQQVYVGNSAWAFVCADTALRQNNRLGGEEFYIPDNTPLQNSFLFMEPFLKSRGYQLSSYKLPYKLIYYGLYFIEFILQMVSPLVKINLPTASCSVQYINMDLYFDGTKGRKLLGYTPLYTPQESIQRSLEYYKHIRL